MVNPSSKKLGWAGNHGRTDPKSPHRNIKAGTGITITSKTILQIQIYKNGGSASQVHHEKKKGNALLPVKVTPHIMGAQTKCKMHPPPSFSPFLSPFLSPFIHTRTALDNLHAPTHTHIHPTTSLTAQLNSVRAKKKNIAFFCRYHRLFLFSFFFPIHSLSSARRPRG